MQRQGVAELCIKRSPVGLTMHRLGLGALGACMVLGLLLSNRYLGVLDHDQASSPRHRRDLQEGPM